MDIVFIEDLRIDAIIGIYDWERQVRQTLSLDLEMAWDNRAAAASDNIEDALNYKSVADRLIQFVAGSEFQLLEAMAEQVCDIVLTEFAVEWLRLRLRKPGAVPQARAVGLLLERGRRAPDPSAV